MNPSRRRQTLSTRGVEPAPPPPDGCVLDLRNYIHKLLTYHLGTRSDEEIRALSNKFPMVPVEIVDLISLKDLEEIYGEDIADIIYYTFHSRVSTIALAGFHIVSCH